MNNTQDLVVISLGGSLVAPVGGPDTEFISNFKEVILSQIEKGQRFYIIVGGGKVVSNLSRRALSTRS